MINKSTEQDRIAKVHFLTKMGQEVKGPLNTITNISNYILNKPNLPLEIKEDLSRIYTSSLILASQIADIIDISQIDTQYVDLVHKPFETERVIADIARLNSIKTHDLGLSFDLYIDRNLPAVQIGDEHKLKQVINYFLGNVCKLTKESQICLTIQRTDNLILYSISDTSCGIPEEIVEKLHEPVFDSSLLDNSTDYSICIIYLLLESMRGYIYDCKDEGINYTICLPIRNSDDSVIGKKTAFSLEQLTGGIGGVIGTGYIEREPMPYGRVLIIDDTEASLSIIHEILKPYYLQISEARSTLKAIELLTSGNEYDLIFMDSTMPDMDALAAIKYLKNMGYTKPIIIVTPNMFQSQLKVFLENGFAGYLSRPIDIKIVDELIKKYIKDIYKHEDIISAKLEFDNTGFATEFFLRDAKRCILALTEIIEQKQFTDENLALFADNVRAIRSSLSYMGFPHLSILAAQIEIALQQKDLHTIRLRAPNFLISISKDIESFTSKGQANEQDLNAEFLDAQLKIIYDSCINKDNIQANNALESLLQKRIPVGIEKMINEISTALKTNDYEAAGLIARKALL